MGSLFQRDVSFPSVRALFSHAPPPLNRALQIAHAKKLIADAAKKQKAAYGNMFSKISVYDDKAAPVMPGTNPNNPKVRVPSGVEGDETVDA